jgi:tetratricopeptide (TPR) repeat protein
LAGKSIGNSLKLCVTQHLRGLTSSSLLFSRTWKLALGLHCKGVTSSSQYAGTCKLKSTGTERALGGKSMKAWTKILADCERLLLPTDESAATHKRPQQRRGLPEAAFRITLRSNADSGIGLENILGGIPKIMPCEVHPVTSQNHARSIQPDEEEQPLGIVMRRAHREDLCLYYRACDTSLVLYTLPERRQSTVMVVPLEGSAEIRQFTLGGNVCRITFGFLTPGRYLVVSFSMINAEELFGEAQQLRKQGLYGKALTLIDEVLEVIPEHSEAWTRKGVMLRNMGRRDEATVAVERALEIDPQSALAWRLKGALLRDASKHQQGLDCYLRSLQLDTNDFLCWENKGNALTALNRTEEAKEAYAEAERVKELYPAEKF